MITSIESIPKTILDDGRLIAIEMEATRQPTANHTKQLEAFRERIGERLLRGVVLHTGTTVQHRHDWLTLAPVSALWNC
ncbi:MAG: hypothetical protein LBJ43_04000 [Propionibacteriaceae bacterium]|nr:hypothetical protein [Propionibacteriaceae bacterium]